VIPKTPVATQVPASSPTPTATATPTISVDPWANLDPQGQTVIFWHNYSRSNGQALQKIVDRFNSTNPWDITVQASYQGSYLEIFNKMMGTLNTQDAPGLAVAYQNQAATYQLGNALVDINSLLDSPKWGMPETDQNDFFPGFWNQDVSPFFGNARLGFPAYRSEELMYYNKDWLAELKAAGKIDFDGPPTTPEQFKAAACAAAQKPFSKGPKTGSIGYEYGTEDASHLAAWTFANGGDIFDDQTSKFTFNSDAVEKASTLIQDLFKDGCATLIVKSYGDQTDFASGKLLFTTSSSSGLGFYKSAVDKGARFKWGVAALPHTGVEPVQNIYGASISIPKTAPETELAAWLFLKYFTSPDVQAEWAIATSYFPVRSSVAANLADYFSKNDAYKYGFDLLKFGNAEPPVPGYDFVRNKVNDAMAAIVDGADVPYTLERLNEDANMILAEQMAAPVATQIPSTLTPTIAPTATAVSFTACQVTDTSGIDDKSLNAAAWKSVTDAMKQFNIQGKYLESTQQTDYEKNISIFLHDKCDIIVTVGSSLGDVTREAAKKTPKAKFSIVDYAGDPAAPNILGQVFHADEAAFLAGYLAAAVSKTGKVGTFGGTQIPVVTVFMDGFYQGVQYYNQQKDKNVLVLGWDPVSKTGLLTGNFANTDDSHTMALSLMDEGADIIMPVAGPASLGAAAAIKERANTSIIGIDTDWYLTAPDYRAIELTSVMKNVDVTTLAAIKSAMQGTFKGGVIVGTLANGGVSLAPFHDLAFKVSADLQAELAQIEADIIAGKVKTTS